MSKACGGKPDHGSKGSASSYAEGEEDEDKAVEPPRKRHAPGALMDGSESQKLWDDIHADNLQAAQAIQKLTEAVNYLMSYHLTHFGPNSLWALQAQRMQAAEAQQTRKLQALQAEPQAQATFVGFAIADEKTHQAEAWPAAEQPEADGLERAPPAVTWAGRV